MFSCFFVFDICFVLVLSGCFDVIIDLFLFSIFLVASIFVKH